MRKSDGQARTIAQLTLNLLLSGATLRAIAAAGVGQYEDVAGFRVALAAFLQPPLAETGDREGRCVVGSAEKNRGAVGLSIVDAIRNGNAFGGGTEIMIVDGCGGALPTAIAFAIRTGDSCEAVYCHALNVAREIAAVPEVMHTLEAARHHRPPDYSHKMGWVLIALQNAFWQLLHAPDFEEGVSASVQAGGDTDTNGAIAGALLGAVCGRASVPQQWINSILTCRPLAGIPGVVKPRPEGFWPVDAPWLAERLLFLGVSEHLELSRQDLVRPAAK